eukprot:11738943-Alexandrium_andersonii.AAC.1
MLARGESIAPPAASLKDLVREGAAVALWRAELQGRWWRPERRERPAHTAVARWRLARQKQGVDGRGEGVAV